VSAWISQIFRAGQAAKGGVVRRSVKSVKKYASENELKLAVKAHRFHMARSKGQYVIFCYPRAFKWFS
jgi:hypothetical protein